MNYVEQLLEQGRQEGRVRTIEGFLRQAEEAVAAGDPSRLGERAELDT